MNQKYSQHIFLTLLGCLLSFVSHSQVLMAARTMKLSNPPYIISGPASVFAGENNDYTVFPFLPSNYRFAAQNGTVIVSNNNSATIKFPSPGSGAVMIVEDATQTIISTYTVTITVMALNAGNITNTLSPTLIYNTTPALLNGNFPTGGNCLQQYDYQWQVSTDNNTFTDIPGAWGKDYQPGPLTITSYFRRKVSCGGLTAYTGSYMIPVYPQLLPGLFLNSASVPLAYNTSPGQIRGFTASGGGCDGAYQYQWEISSDGVNYLPISGATSMSYTPGALVSRTYFRRKTTCSTEVAYGDVFDFPVSQPFATGTISPLTQNITFNKIPVLITCTAASGGSCGSYTYQWESSTDNINFTAISGATGLDFQAGNLTTTTFFRRKAVCASTTGYSSTAIVVVSPELTGGTISSIAPIPYNSSPGTITCTTPTGGNGSAYNFQWEFSLDNLDFIPVTDATTTSYTPGNLLQQSYYRRKVTCGPEHTYSNTITIAVNPFLNGGTISPSGVVIPINTSPGMLSGNPASGGNCVSFEYQWQHSSDGTLYFDISGANGQAYTPGNLSSTMHYRRKVTCGTTVSYSTVCMVTVGTTSVTDLNYIKTRDFTKPGVTNLTSANTVTDAKDVKEIIQYYDGFGRVIQTVGRQASTDLKDIVQPELYDGFGRKTIQYLPYVATTNTGEFQVSSFTAQNAFNASKFPGENYFYSQVNYEPSPLNRPKANFAPGINWIGSNKGIHNEYLFNTAKDSVRIWDVTDVAGNFGTYQSPSAYLPGELYKSINVDEHGKQVIEFKDKSGNVILKKVQEASGSDNGEGKGHVGWTCTYYMYDQMNNLRCVIQPEGVRMINSNWVLTNTTILAEQCFRYEYDGRHRIIRKKVPGAGEVYMVYDQWDRLVLQQDANLRTGNKWLFTKYDEQNRPVLTGIYTNTTTTGQAAMQTLLNTENLGRYETYNPAVFPTYSLDQTFPVVVFSNVLTVNYYDDYKWASWYSGNSFQSKDNSYDNRFPAPSTTWPYPESLSQSNESRGLPTGNWDKVGLLKGVYYDKKGRINQIKSYNLTQGTDILTTQYSFDGKILQAVLKQQKGGSNAQSHIVTTKNSYDAHGRLTNISKKVQSNVHGQQIEVPEHDIASMEYDKLGELKSKVLAPGYNGGNGLETLTFDYNIRNWLLGINRSYLNDAGEHYFGFELGYDKSAAGVNGTSYSNPQYNGNISGTIWRSAGDGVKRKFDYEYDALNRLTGADFKQYDGGSFNTSQGIDFSVREITYDLNGNIKAMNQMGWKFGGSQMIDSLLYTYYDQSNRLKNVIDRVNDTATKLGDFRSSKAYMNSLLQIKTMAAVDYVYDDNGNLKRDRNKDIGNATTDGIVYNHLNLPVSITVRNDAGGVKGTILYTYDAAGTKLKKVVQEAGLQDKTTTYIQSFVYENDTLQFMSHEEGRTRFTKRHFQDGDSAYQFVDDYFLKDHLGNVRMVLTEQQDTAIYFATMEQNFRQKEEQLFYNIGTTATSLPAGYPADGTTTDPNDFVAVTNGSGNKVGPAIVLKVMSGDSLNIRVKSFFKPNGSPGSNADPMSDILLSLATGITSSAGALKGSTSQLSDPQGPLAGMINLFRDDKHADRPSKPRAYLNWMLLDEQMKYDSAGSGADAVKNADVLDVLSGKVKIKKNGYIYIYLSNETQNWNVYYNDLVVEYVTGPILEETHYYPFGLTMAGISSKRLNGAPENKKKFIGQQFDDELGLNWYQFRFRNHDPQIGRFIEIDPLADKYVYNSTYAYAENKVGMGFDLEGLELQEFNRMFNAAGIKVGDENKKIQARADNLNKAAEPYVRVTKDVITIAGGVTLLVASGGTAAPLLVGLAGSATVAGGTMKLAFDVSGNKEAADQIPTTLSGTAIFLTNGVSEAATGQKLISDDVKTVAEFSEGVLTFNVTGFNKMTDVEKVSTILSGISLTLDGVSPETAKAFQNLFGRAGSKNVPALNIDNKPKVDNTFVKPPVIIPPEKAETNQ